jgi:hypothetical protein
MRATNAKMDFEAFGVRDIELPRLRPRARYVKANLRFGEFGRSHRFAFLLRDGRGDRRAEAYVPSIVASWRVTQKGAIT